MFGEGEVTERDRMIASGTKLKLAMANAGLYEAIAQKAMSKSADLELSIRWQNSINIRRTDKWINDLAVALEISDEQLDALFEASWSIE
jgi:hypothetical protein